MSGGSSAARVGTTLRGRYRLDAVLGVGGMATVYRAVHRSGHRVAIKILHPEISLIEDVRTRFLKEGYVANAVERPGVVRVIDDDTTEDAVFLVMELLEGETVEARRERNGNRLLVEEAAAIGWQLLDVLAVAHQPGIVHRDIKPENLFITRDGALKVLDFGIARVGDGASAAVTRTGRMMGTPAFMPKEQALGLTREIDSRTDLWAVGATMYTLRSGAYVHPAETAEAMMVRSATQPARSIAEIAPHVSVAIARTIDRALAFEKVDRFPDALTMRVALEEAFLGSFARPLKGAVQLGADPPHAARAVDAPVVATVMANDARAVEPRAALAPAPAAKQDAPMVGSTTAGVGAESTSFLPRKGPPTALLAIAGLLVVGAVGFAVVRGLSTTTTAAGIIAAPASAPSPSPSSAVPVPSPSTASAEAARSEPTPPAAVATGTAHAENKGTPGDAPSTAKPTSKPISRVSTTPTSTAATPTPTPTPTATATPTAANPCDPPYTIDPVTKGRRVKPGC